MQGKVVIVTAASKGMGAACARELARQGCRLVIMARSAAIHDIAEQTGAIGLQGDVTKLADLRILVDKAVLEYGRVDGVVVNTGHPARGDLLAIADDDWHAGMDLLLLNVVRIARLVVPSMRVHGGGAIVNISTYAAREPSLDYPLSSAMRAATGAFTKLFAKRFALDNIRMNCILPGYVDSFAVPKEAVANIPLGRPGSVTEIARTAAFLLSDGGAYISGQSICVDGGLTHSF